MTQFKVGQELTSELLNTITQGQAAIVDAIETWAATVQSIKPDLPDVHVPFADKLPSPQEVVASAYDFAEQLLASQRKFAEDLLKATATLVPAGPAGSEKQAAGKGEE